MITCSKTYADIPLAHRQHKHAGHCRFIHGHSWSIRVTFACTTLDEHGFVIDFGNLGYLRDWIDQHLDHAIMLSHDDAQAKALVESAPELFKVFWIENASCEGLSQAVYEAFNAMVQQHEAGRVHITEIQVWEDPRNATRYTP